LDRVFLRFSRPEIIDNVRDAEIFVLHTSFLLLLKLKNSGRCTAQPFQQHHGEGIV